MSPPDGAPNVLVVLLDDMGFGASSAFGGPVDTPCAEALADNGLRFTRFHTTAVCAPTRASLLTGRNAHAIGFGLVPEMASSFPGYTCVRPASAATIARILRDNGYCTGAFGKMHQTPAYHVSPAGPFERWPTGDGFDRFYGFLTGETDQYYPALFDGTTTVDPPSTPEEGYHLSEDLVDKAIAWIHEQRAMDPERPFFSYLAFGAPHAPLQVPRSWSEKYRGRFDHGWNLQREQTLERQKEIGVVPQDAQLPAWGPDLPEWDDLSDEEQRAAAALMEVAAGFTEHTDAQIGRLIGSLEELGVLDNTLVFYILGDNGASAEGGRLGTTNEWRALNGVPESAEEILAKRYELGGPTTYPQYASGWALAMDTPYQWAKIMASHYGGMRNPLIVHWPSGLPSQGLRHQWHHVNDVVPTILEAAGIPAPDSVDGVEQQRMDGVSMAYAFADPDAPDRHVTQYFEVMGNRSIYHDGWTAGAVHRRPATWPDERGGVYGPFAEDVWELYDTRSDWTQATDVASEHPERLEALKQLFLVEAAKNQVLPLDDRLMERFLPDERPDMTYGRSSVTYPGSMPWLIENAVISVRNRSHVITATFELAAAGATGVLAVQGSMFGGWAVYLLEGVPTYCYNFVGRDRAYVRGAQGLAPGRHEVRVAFTYDGGGLGKGGTVELAVDGAIVGSGRLEHTVPFSLGASAKFSIGRACGTPVTPEYEGAPVAFPGTVVSVRIDGDPDEEVASQAGRVETALKVQ